ncbi:MULTISPECIES: hypothetical protein [Bacillus cereus group]|uniref:Uncharacterized protein n=1 Tax=Bacillus thuringiensis TaxID=1428 RepID=A0A9X6WHX9_BACTU|nr:MULTISPECIES: hypothetical protein [Bacillus cereus group]MDA1674536.1 hypothetical protein [Bacillus cereus group sp. TH152-1LC]PFJ30279.1 hypothetical protein COJ15_31225 [Bacillus thuringiensis]PGP12478.1 hypothetical protein COA01_32180 [Bacillus cereus]
MEKMLVKIYKTATKMSIMDIMDALDFHRKNDKNEVVYRGNLQFIINEYGSSKNQETAYLTKAGAKQLFYAIVNHHFPKIYANGYSEYGGSNKNGVVRSRILSVDYEQEKHRFKFQIDEGPGRMDGNGSIKMIKKEKSVRTYVAYDDAIKMGHEVLDYIKQAEFAAIMRGKPFYTLIPDYRNNRKQDGNHVSNEEYIHNHDSFSQEEPSQYIIKIGNLAGKPIAEMDTNTLEALVAKINPDSPELAELLEEAKKELARRY